MKSAKTKAKEFCRYVELPDYVEEELVVLLKEHERDTRHTAIDNLLLLERHEFANCNEDGSWPDDGVELDQATQTVLNTEVKDEV